MHNIAVYGCTSYDFIAGGTGSGNVNRAYTVSLLDGLHNAGYKTDDALRDSYLRHIADHEASLVPDTSKFAAFLPKRLPDEMLIAEADLRRQAREADVALITIGRMSGEFLDRESADFKLSDNNRRLIDDVTRAFHAAGKKVIVVLNIGGVIETESWKGTPDAILCAWQGGQEGGNSVADILSGKTNPAGKLTMTFPVSFEDHASTANFPVDTKGNTDITDKSRQAGAEPVRLVDYTPYEEDIYVGYRYFDTFGKKVSYPFGYGLSYTTFGYSKPSIAHDADGNYLVKVDITNTGKRAGKEVVQLYVAAPDAKQANKPEKELKAFAKTRELAPGETQTVEMTVRHDDLASFDEAASQWTVTPGRYDFLLGASSADIRASLQADAAAKTIKAHNILAPKAELKRLTR